MKLTLALITALLPLLTSTQNVSGEPPCATACITSAIQAAGCAPTDQACPCGPSQTAIASYVAPCLLASCPASLLVVVQSVGLALCAAYSSSLTAGGLTGSGSASAAATATATVAPITSITVTATAGGNGTLGNGIPPVSVSSSKGNLTVIVNTSGVTALTTKTGTATVAASAASTSSTGGSSPNYLVGSMGGLAAGFIGLVAAL